VQFPHEAAQQAEVVVRGRADVRPDGRRVNVRDVRADGDVYRNRDAPPVCLDEHRLVGVRRLCRFQPAAKCLAQPDAIRCGGCAGGIDAPPGFLRATKSAAPQGGIHVFRSRPDERNFKVVNGARPVAGKGRNEPPRHEVNQDGAQPTLDDVAAETGNHRAPPAPGRPHGRNGGAQFIDGKQVGQGSEKGLETRPRRTWTGQITRRNLARTFRQRIGVQPVNSSGGVA
jgi:hypothetical protein